MATIYQEVLGDRFTKLPIVLQRFLGDDHGARGAGRFTVTRAPGRLRRFAAWALGIPPAGDHDLKLEVIPHPNAQCWIRRFGSHGFATMQTAWHGLLIERKGLASLGFELTIDGDALLFRPRRAWILGLPVPLWLSPRIEAENRPAGAGWHVRVIVSVPLLGRVAEYAGVVAPITNSDPTTQATPDPNTAPAQ